MLNRNDKVYSIFRLEAGTPNALHFARLEIFSNFVCSCSWEESVDINQL